MRARILKSLALAALLLMGTGALPEYCYGPCAPADALITIDAIVPADGSQIVDETVTITFAGADERSVSITDYSMSGQLLQRIEGGDWVTVRWLWEPDMVLGPWQEGGSLECGYRREITAITVEGLDLGEGENEFWLRLVITDGHYDNRYWDFYVTYTH